MNTPATQLQYHSRDGGATAPGEIVLWEGVPLPKPRERMTIHNTIAVLVVGAVTFAGWYFPELVSTWLAAGLTFVFAVVALKALNDHFGDAGRKTDVTSEQRVTTRRIIRTDQHGAPAVTQVDFESLTHTTVRRDQTGRTSVQFQGADFDEPGDADVTFDGVADAAALVRLTLPLPARLNRRAKFRRGRAAPHRESDTFAGVNAARETLPDDVTLVDGEVVLWHGRPRKWERIDARFVLRKALTLVALIVPVTILLAATGVLGIRWHASHWATTVMSIIWLWLGLYALTIGPFSDARSRERTRYILTNVRAITHESGRKTQTRSTMLDMAGSATLVEQPDGTGSVQLSIGGGFEHIERPAEVYPLVLEAIRAAGGPSSYAAESNQPQHVGGGGREQA